MRSPSIGTSCGHFISHFRLRHSEIWYRRVKNVIHCAQNDLYILIHTKLRAGKVRLTLYTDFRMPAHAFSTPANYFVCMELFRTLANYLTLYELVRYFALHRTSSLLSCNTALYGTSLQTTSRLLTTKFKYTAP